MSTYKLMKNIEEPYCEHCGPLEIGSFVFYDTCSYWCIGCKDADKPIPKAKLKKLLEDQNKNLITAHKKRLFQLTGTTS